MDKSLFLGMALVLGVLYFLIGYYISSSVTSVSDYFLANRKLNFFQIAIALIATQLGGGFILGTSKEAYTVGYYGILYVLGVCIGFIVLALGIAGRLRALNVETTAQLFQTHYKSSFLKKLASLCSIISLIGIFAAQIVGSRSLMVSLDVYNPIIFTLFWFGVVLYATYGGLRAIVQNDTFQLSLIIIVFVSLFIMDLIAHFDQAATIFGNKLSIFGLNNTTDIATLAMIPLMPALYSLIEQDLAQVFFAARTARLAILAAASSAFFLLFFAVIPLYFGMKARLVGTVVSIAGNPLISYFDQNYSSFIVTVVTYGVFAAIISTANGVLCAISSNIVQDFELDKGSERRKLLISQVVMLSVGLIGLLLGSQCNNLIKVLVDSYAVPVSGLLISLLVVYFAKPDTYFSTLAAYLSVVIGLGSFLLLLVTKSTILISAELDALLLSLISYIIGYAVDRFMYKK